jgi:hypothetical protein
LHNIKINLKEAGNESDQSIIQAQGRKSCHVFVTREIKRRVTFKEWEFLQLLREKTGPRISKDCCNPCASTNTGQGKTQKFFALYS